MDPIKESNQEEQQPPYLQQKVVGALPEENSNDPPVPPGIMQPMLRPQSAEHSDAKGAFTLKINPREATASDKKTSHVREE